MAGKKKSYTSRKKKSYKKRSYKKVRALPSKWQATPKVELKALDLGVASNVAIPLAGAALRSSLNVIPTGTTFSTRIGKEVVIRKIQGNMLISIPVYDTSNKYDDTVRLFLVLDTQKNGTAVPFEVPFQNNHFGTMNHLGNSKRFRILKKWTVDLKVIPYFNGTGMSSNDDSKLIKFNLKCKIPIRWNADNTDGAETAMNNNNIALYGISRNGAAYLAGSSGNYFSYFRIRYSDA